LPGLLRKGRPVAARHERRLALTAIGRAQDPAALGARAASQAAALARLAAGPSTVGALRDAGIPSAPVGRLEERAWILTPPAGAPDTGCRGDARALPAAAAIATAERGEPPALTADQRAALDAIRGHDAATFLLYGVTGSGKTEVFLRLVAEQL